MQVTKQKELVRQTEAEPNTKAEGLLDMVRQTQRKKTEDTLTGMETEGPVKTVMAWQGDSKRMDGWVNIQKNDVEKDMGRNRKVDSEMREAKGCSGKLTDRKKRGR